MSPPRLALDTDVFLATHWQREPLFIPRALPDFTPPLSADELAGLALEPDIESRLVEEADGRWSVSHGPFSPADFDRPGHWTLLVQSVDHYLPAVAALRQLVDFLPQWRIDDVMVSYASPGGSVGPHYDNYDVFLLQGHGQRRWRLGQRCDEHTPLLPHPELRVLRDFEQTAEYLLGPGDILYVPPGVAHWGVAEGECTTFSLGFRAPRIVDLVSRQVDHLLEQSSPEPLFSDAGRDSGRPGEITRADIDRARRQVLAAVAGTRGDEWFGELVTETQAEAPADTESLSRALAAGGALLLSPESRLAWQETPGGVTVYAAGQALHADASVLPMLVLLCKRWRLEPADLPGLLGDGHCASVLDALYRQGCVHVSE